MAQNLIDHLLSKNSSNVMEAVKSLECKGRLKFYTRNLYTYVSTDDNFSFNGTHVLESDGFQLVPLMLKDFSPMTHISCMTWDEQHKLVARNRVSEVCAKWQNTEITFEIEAVQMYFKWDKVTKHPKIVCCLKVKSNQIEAIREDLGLSKQTELLNLHMTLCEKFL